ALRLPRWTSEPDLHRAACQEPGEGCREGHPRHDSQDVPRPPADDQAQGLRRRRAPPRCSAAQARRDHPGGPVMSETNNDSTLEQTPTDAVESDAFGTDADDAVVSEYTSESDTAVAGEPTRRPSASAPGSATGRRKQAVA